MAGQFRAPGAGISATCLSGGEDFADAPVFNDYGMFVKDRP